MKMVNFSYQYGLKRIFALVLFVMICGAVQAQFKFKVDYAFETYFRWAGSNTTVSLDLVVPPSNTGQRLFTYTAFNGPIETVSRINDQILETSTRYTHLTRRINGSASTIPIRCWNGPELDSYLPALVGIGGRLVIYEIRPLAEVNNYSGANNQLLDCTGFSVSVHNNPDCSSASYEVQYQVGSSTVWNTLLAYGQRGSSFSFFRSNFSGLDIGENLRIRVRHDDPSQGGTPEYSDILTYVYTLCTPNTASISTQPTSCVYTTDGGFTLNFDRSLNTGETLGFVLRANSPTGPIISSPTGVSFAGTSYSWPDGLASGNYYLEYQTEPTGNVLSEGPITIGAPSPVTFSSTWTDVDCFGENTGSIRINASGGAGNYQYRLNTGAWMNFSGANNHTITNLNAGNYQIRVRDANGCTEQE